VGVGLVLTFSLSATRLLAPSTRWWLPIVLVFSAAAFLVGYLLPLGSAEEPAEDPDRTIERPVSAPPG
jgi:hypothetical protein